MLSQLFLDFLPGTRAQSSKYVPGTYPYFYLTTVVKGNVRGWKMTNVAYVQKWTSVQNQRCAVCYKAVP